MGKKLNQIDFIKRSNKIHNNKYDYSLVDYKNCTIKTKIICKIHGIFEQQPQAHLNGQGCPKCGGKMRKTKEEFIIESNKIHNNKYDYSLVEYKNNKTKIKIICPEHGIFEQRADMHTQGHGCDKCSGTYNLTTEIFIEKSTKIHENKYDYSLVNYINGRTKIKIICPIHGIFEQKPSEHLSNQGCGKCANKNITTDEFIEKVKKIHNNLYNYSLVDYKKSKEKIKIICKKHGFFYQTPSDHLSGMGCPKCANKNITTDEFIEKAKKIHNDRYDYSLVRYKKCNQPVEIICPIHGKFKQAPSNHQNGNGCPVCNDSKGEKEISKYLLENKIQFERQKRFDACRNIKPLPFDFFISKQNICIEFDGEQHFIIHEKWGGKIQFEKIQKRDQIKNNFCKNNNIKLIRIKYNENIIKKLDQIFKKE
jgi:very-short-patch-repair endonuclease